MDLKTITSKGTPYKKRNRLGRGTGSGNGKTSGRGHGGLGSRSGSSRRPGYEGGQMPIYRRIPKRGFTNARFRKDYTIINVGALGVFNDGDVVDLAAVLAKGLVSKNTDQLKVLGNGELTVKLTIRAQKCSKSAQEKITAAGGTVLELDSKGRECSGEAPAEEAAQVPAEAPEEEVQDTTTEESDG
jgi:large subunit ribosomal protein L15